MRPLVHNGPVSCLVGTIPVLMLAAVLSGCTDSRASTPKPAAKSATPAREVRVVPAAESRVPRTIGVTGTLAADDQVVLSLKVAGRIIELPLDLGTQVHRGQVVARLDPTDFRLRVDQARAGLHQARARLGLSPDGTDDRIDVEQTALVRQARAVLDEARLSRERFAQLYTQQFVAKAQLDTAVANEQVADGRYQDAVEEVRNRQAIVVQRRTELELARQALVDTELSAPIDGMIRERRAAVGEFLAAGAPVAMLVKIHPLRLQLAVPERAAADVRIGQDVRVSVDGDPRAYTGRVVRLSPSIQEQNRTLTLEAEVPNPTGALRPGSFARAEIVIAVNQATVFVPASSIIVFAGIEKVLTVRDGKTLERRVVTGRREKDRVEITEGLKAGEPVIVEPGNLTGGQAVVVRQ
ncbi:MAG: efflux RND transporter periplasmic adaptor subunit [Candidatus Rokuibacteriota bacterium]|nr:MAG: efflux RND transporter periplasmic adaptor subunit [Candidatus Rokubacteria bacterium]